MSREGRITIELGARPARIVSTRRTGIAAMMAGREAREVVRLLPRLFALCAEAHGAAAALALFGHCDAARMRRVLAESAREHLLRILMCWRTEDGPPLPAAPVMDLVENARKGRDVAGALAGFLRVHVLGMAPEAFLSLTDPGEWLRRSDTGPARYLRAVIARGWSGIGAVEPAFLQDLPAAELVARLADDAFAAAPEWDGPRETGPLARQYGHPLVASACAQHGAGLLARHVARLVEMARLPAALGAARARQCTPGLGVVETARGRLIHAATTEGDRVTRYAILAPTEWNFHPAGVAAQALAGLGPEQAAAVVEAIDPCVEYRLRAA